MKSILQENKECLVCRSTNVALHHVFFGTANRKKSDEYGLVVFLCQRHHNTSNAGVHFNKQLDLKIKQMAQRKFEEIYGHEKFMQEFGRNWL